MRQRTDRTVCSFWRIPDDVLWDGPAGAKPPEPLPREWYAYTILHDAYVEDRLSREIMGKLYISEGTYFRLRRQVLRSVARASRAKENSPRLQSGETDGSLMRGRVAADRTTFRADSFGRYAALIHDDAPNPRLKSGAILFHPLTRA